MLFFYEQLQPWCFQPYHKNSRRHSYSDTNTKESEPSAFLTSPHRTTPAVRKDIQWFCVTRAVRKDIHTSNFQLYAIPLAARKCYSDSLSDQIKQTTLDASTLAVRKDIQRSTLFQASALYSVLQSTTPVLLCTTKYYSSTTPYYTVLLQYYSVLQSTTPVLESTAPVLIRYYKVYYSSTNLYYKVPSHMKRYLQRAEQQESASNFRKYCACHEK